MTEFTKRDLTHNEEKAALSLNARIWDAKNPDNECSLEFWRARLKQAKAEGYKSERCSCGVDFLAFHHFTTCHRVGCPISTGEPLWQQYLEDTRVDGGPMDVEIEIKYEDEQ